MATRAARKRGIGGKPGRRGAQGRRGQRAAHRQAAQRGTRASADGRVRGARGIPRARRVAQASAAAGQPGPALGQRDGRGDRVRRGARDLRHAARQQAGGRTRPRARHPEAIEVLTPAGVEALIGATKTFDFFERTPLWDAAPERFRLHAVATQRAADRLCSRIEFPDRDEVLVSSLLHDIGKLVLVQAYPGYPGQIHTTARTPEQRIHARAPRARHRPRAGRRRHGPPLGPAPAARRGDRAPPLRRRRRRGRDRAPRRHAGPLRTGPGGRAGPAAGGRAPDRPRPAGPARGAVRAARPAAGPQARGHAVPALRRASWRC